MTPPNPTPPADDIDRIMAVMAVAFDPTFGEAWNRRQVEDALLLGRCRTLLIDINGQVGTDGQAATDSPQPTAGFALLRTTLDEEELLLFAVDPQWRRRGLGAELLRQVIATARASDCTRMLLEMREGNSAEQLYVAFGFVPVGRRPKYYRTPTGQMLDAITFSCDLG